MTCTHHWTVTSECPYCLRAIVERLLTRPDSEAADQIEIVRGFLRRVTHWQEGKPDCHDAMLALDAADDDVDWIEHGIVEWREEALRLQERAKKLSAEVDALRKLAQTFYSDKHINEVVSAAIADICK